MFGVIGAFRCFLNEESGATSIEYGMVAAVISLTIIGAATTIGGDLRGLFTSLSSTLQSASSGS